MKKFNWKSILDGTRKTSTIEIQAEIQALEVQKAEAEQTLEDIEKALERGRRSLLAGENVDIGQIRADLEAVRDRIGTIDAVINDLELTFEDALNQEGMDRRAGLQKQLAVIEKLRAEGEDQLIDLYAKAAALFESVRGIAGDELSFRAFSMTPAAPLVRQKIKAYAEGQRNLKAEANQLRHEIEKIGGAS